ncbi:hypothetical protein [Saccharothrix obliqua]|uniref:hypothetical protein n=1 Tax=Saccharothrix obliqua TaxID=2861747 RepID=UPI001C605CC8|nr:hypothetical protein [Saccharothrix obliqua]MBW4718816.1 hypothetical protein [Saccharothrix obliqua]
MFDSLKPTPPPPTGWQHVVKPPRPVWVDLGAVYRVGAPRRNVPDAMDLQATVPGELRLWHLTTTGHWVGYVTFAIHSGQGRTGVGQWVLADALRPRPDAPDRRSAR